MDERVIAAARDIEEHEGVGAEVLLAVALVETGGVPFTAIGERAEPLIRFEGHYFDRRLSGEARSSARALGLAHPRAGAVRNPRSQAARWALFERASAIDAQAAAASTSWGLGQVMGAHGRLLGYGDALGLAAAARTSISGQLGIVANFLKQGALGTILARGEVEVFARRYNGPNFRQNRYDEKITAALRRARMILGQSIPLSQSS